MWLAQHVNVAGRSQLQLNVREQYVSISKAGTEGAWSRGQQVIDQVHLLVDPGRKLPTGQQIDVSPNKCVHFR
jgi:hypothetical protein